jgi:hypothetical protein
MVPHSHRAISLALATLLAVSGPSRTPPQTSDAPQQPTYPEQTSTTRPPSASHGHDGDTTTGHTPHGSSDGAAIGGAIGAVGAGVLIGELIAHHNSSSPEKLSHDGPQVPKQFDMNSFVVKGLARPNWPVVLDFILDSPGAVQIDIIAADNKHHYRAIMANSANHRAYGIIHLPPDFGQKLQTAAYQVRSVSNSGANTPPPRLRTFGLGAGDKAVGSVAIDQLTFKPATIHPAIKEVANYGFHAHSAFDGVRAEFIFTTLYNGHVLIEKDQEAKLAPIPEGERARGTWEGKGKSGEHMLQIRAWRGLESGGDWVVAWSPDIVDVVK